MQNSKNSYFATSSASSNSHSKIVSSSSSSYLPQNNRQSGGLVASHPAFPPGLYYQNGPQLPPPQPNSKTTAYPHHHNYSQAQHHLLTVPEIIPFPPTNNLVPPPPESTKFRNRNNAPVIKLTVKLVDTFLNIGKSYYLTQKKRRQQSTKSTDHHQQQQQQHSQGSPSKRCRFNDGYDDAQHNYIIRTGEVWNDRYKVIKILGKGSFGQVVEAHDMQERKRVAVKIIKNRKAFYHQGLIEISILKLLNSLDPRDTKNIVRFHEHFDYRNHLCLVYEILSFNLYELLRNDNFTGVSLDLVRKFAIQILQSLSYLSDKRVQVIHCDLKPENILLSDSRSCKLKVIDFGSACFLDEKMYTYIQSRFYRSPEVLLGRPYDLSIDMWSLGCLLVELHTGYPLFNGSNEHDQLCRIHELLGDVPEKLLKTSSQEKLSKFYAVTPVIDARGQHRAKYTLLSSRGFQPRPGLTISDVLMKIKHPNDRIRVLTNLSDDEKYKYELFLDFLLRALDYDPETRITPQEALKHPFCKVSHATNTPADGLRSKSKRLIEMQQVKSSDYLNRNMGNLKLK